MTPDQLRADGWTVREIGGFVGHVGPFWRHVGPHGTRYGFVADERHENMLGVVQGGMLMTFADRALGLEAWGVMGDRPSVTIQCNTQFISSAPIGAFVTIAPRVVRAMRSLIFMEGTMFSGDAVVAHVQGTWKLVGPRPVKFQTAQGDAP